MSLLDKASLIVTPNAVKESKLYSVVPSSGAGDMTVVRATTATRVNSANLVEVVPRNLFTDSDGLISTYPVRGGNIIQASTPISGFANSVEFQNNLTSSFLYKTFATTTGTTYVISVFVQMNDNSTPVPSLNQNSGDFSLILSGEGPSNLNVERIGTSNVYRISGRVTSINTNMNYGVVKYNTQSAKAFKVAGYQLEFGTAVSEFLITTTRLNIPRIDYTNGSCPSLLVEPQRTNLTLYSEQFDNAYWIKDIDVTVNSNASISPSGNLDADRVNFASNNKAIYKNITATGTHRFSIYLKGEGSNIGKQIQLLIGNVGGTVNVTLTSQWQRFTTDASTSTYVGVSKVGALQADSVLIWGSQLEAGAYPTSYIPTIASTVTRNADVISKTGISSLIGQTEGVFYAEMKLSANDGTQKAISINDGGLVNRIFLRYTSSINQIRILVQKDSIIQYDNSQNILNSLNFIKIALNYKNNNFKLFINGILVNSSLTGTTFSGSTLNEIDFNDGTANPFFGNINSIQLYKTALTDQECINLTTL